MERNTNWKPNEQGGGDSVASNANDWRSQHDPEKLRKRVRSLIVEKLREDFPNHSQDEINLSAVKFEEKIYGLATDQVDYLRKVSDRMRMFEKKCKSVQLASSVNATNTPNPAAQVVNQTQFVPTSVQYTETSTSQQLLPQNTQSNINSSRSFGLPTQVPVTVSVGQSPNTHISEGAHINSSHRQMQGRQQPQNSNYMFQQQVQPTQQQLPCQKTSLSQPIQQSLPQASALSSLPSSGQQNSYLQPRHQFQTQRVSSSHQHQTTVLSQEEKQQKQDQIISQLMNGQDTQQKHLTTGQNNGAFRVSSSQKNYVASIQAMTQQNMHQQRLNSASALPSQQKQDLPCGQSSLLGTQGQEVGQSQQYQPQHSVQKQQLPQRVYGAGSLLQTQNIPPDQQNQPYQLQRGSLANSSTSQDSTGKTGNAIGGDWQEETYQKIQVLKEKHLPILITLLPTITEKLRKIESLPPQEIAKRLQLTENLQAYKLNIERIIVYLNVQRSNISEKHRDKFGHVEEHTLRLTKNLTMRPNPMQQQQQGQLPPSQIHQTALKPQSPQVHVSQSLDKNQMSSRLMPSNQNAASSSVNGLTTSQTAIPHPLQTRPNMEPRDENNNMASSGSVVLPSLKPNPQVVQSNSSTVQSNILQPQQQQQLLHKQQQQQQQLQQAKQQLQKPTSTIEMNDARIRQGVNIKAELIQKHLSSSKCQLLKPLASPAQTHHHSSPQSVDQQILPATVCQTETPSKSGGSSVVAPSPEKPISVESPVLHAQSTLDSSTKLGTDEKPLFSLPPEPITERPIDRLIKAFQSSSPKSLAESVSEMSSVISMVDSIAGSFHHRGRSRAGLGDDFSARNLMTDGETHPTKRLKCSISTLPLDIASQTDSYKQLSSMESEFDSTASYGSKVNKIELGCTLLQEIKEINGRLIETVVEICSEDTSGTIVMCSYEPVALSATFKDHYKSGKISQIQPLRLLVPANYPYTSPRLLEEIAIDASVHKYEDLSARTRSRFSYSMKELPERVSLKEIAQTWNDCARATMIEYAERHGGGTFSSKYGAWETVQRAS